MIERMVEIDRLTVELGGATILRDVSLDVRGGSFTVVIGPNGSGKTTLLRSIYRAVPRASGTIRIGGVPIEGLEQREIGQRVGVLRQESHLAFDFLVEELVMMGRSPHKSVFAPDRAEDRAIVDEALRLTDVAHLRGRSFATLSGGERQRVLLSRALAQRPSLLILDEPTNHLDIRHQLEVLACVKRLGVTVLAALHDLNLAQTFATAAVLLAGGRVVARGPAEEVLASSAIKAAFGVEVERLEARDGRTILGFSPVDPEGDGKVL